MSGKSSLGSLLDAANNQWGAIGNLRYALSKCTDRNRRATYERLILLAHASYNSMVNQLLIEHLPALSVELDTSTGSTDCTTCVVQFTYGRKKVRILYRVLEEEVKPLVKAAVYLRAMHASRQHLEILSKPSAQARMALQAVKSGAATLVPCTWRSAPGSNTPVKAQPDWTVLPKDHVAADIFDWEVLFAPFASLTSGQVGKGTGKNLSWMVIKPIPLQEMPKA